MFKNPDTLRYRDLYNVNSTLLNQPQEYIIKISYSGKPIC